MANKPGSLKAKERKVENKASAGEGNSRERGKKEKRGEDKRK